MADAKIKIKNLFKIFGNKPDQIMPLVRQGMSKQELLDEHKHVLGLSDINIDIPEKRIHVIMGLSGSGKSTLIRHINRLIEPTDGQVIVDGDDVMEMSSGQLMQFRRFKASMVFQKFALLPHRTVAQNAAYGLTIQGVDEGEAVERSQRWLERVGLGGFEKHFPAQLSGGMQQRVGLARALATDAEILLMDEAFSALDPLIRNDMQGILLDLQKELHKTIVFITHDLGVVAQTADKVSVMYLGKLIEEGPVREVILDAKHPYTRGLLSALPRLDDLDAPLTPVPGDIPSPLERPSGCVFNTRCSEVVGDVCTATIPLEQWVDSAHRVSCHIYDRQHKGGGAS